MSDFEQPFRYHAIACDGQTLLGTFDTQPEATKAVLRHGEQVALAPGQSKAYIVRIESKESGNCYDIEIQVEAPAQA